MRARSLFTSLLVLLFACGGGTQKGPVGPPPEYEDPEQPVPTGASDAGPSGAGPAAPPDEPPPATPPPSPEAGI